MSADLILKNGRVLTFNDECPRAQVVAIEGERIAAVGGSDLVETWSGTGTKIVDLDGACVIPGFNDAHAHMEREGLKHQRLSLAGARSVPDILARVSSAAARTPAGDWIVTMPVGEPPHYFDALETIAERRMPTRAELDAAAPNHPVYVPALFGNWGHPPGRTALNSMALAINRITSNSCPRCSGVEIVCDPVTREPTGQIIEHNARPTVEFDLLPRVPRFRFSERIEGTRRSMQLYNACGTTSIYEGHGSAPETISVYRQLWERRELTVRVGLVVSPSWADVAEARKAMRDWLAYARGRGIGDPWLRISGIHVAYGGDPMVAAVARENLPDTGWSGFIEQAHGPDDFREICFLAAEHDLRLHTIVSDKLHEIVPIIEAVNEKFPIRDRRWVIEHIARARMDDLRALKRLGLYVTTIPTYVLWKGGKAYLADPDDGESVVAHRSMLDLGLPLAIATDNIPYDPIFTLWVTAARTERATGRVIGPTQCLDAHTALRLFTVAGAHLTFDETWKGPIRAGFAADIAVLSDDPTTTSPERLRDITCRMTIVGGRVVHGLDRPGEAPRSQRQTAK
jgi:predicted amidohydrolase YtcJ